MVNQCKLLVITLVGGILTLIGAVFIVLPGPAFLFLPIGLAILSIEYPWAKVWLRRCQRVMREGAAKLDKITAKVMRKIKR